MKLNRWLTSSGRTSTSRRSRRLFPEILERIRKYDNRDHKALMHIRFDAATIKLLNQFKMATGVDVTKLVAFSVHHLLGEHPELKTIIKQFIQQLEL